MLSWIPGPAHSVDIYVNRPVEHVWGVVTETTNFGYVVRGSWYWGTLDLATARVGATFGRSHMLDDRGRITTYYVVNWAPLRRFSVGPTVNEWSFDFLLTANGDGTTLQYSRRYNALAWFAKAWGRRDAMHTAQKIVSLTEAEKPPPRRRALFE